VHLQGFVTQIVFDAQYQTLVAIKKSLLRILSVYYTDFGQTADTYIEKSCFFSPLSTRELPQQLPPANLLPFSADCRHFRPGTAIDGTGVLNGCRQKLGYEVNCSWARRQHKSGKQTPVDFSQFTGCKVSAASS